MHMEAHRAPLDITNTQQAAYVSRRRRQAPQAKLSARDRLGRIQVDSNRLQGFAYLRWESAGMREFRRSKRPALEEDFREGADQSAGRGISHLAYWQITALISAPGTMALQPAEAQPLADTNALRAAGGHCLGRRRRRQAPGYR